MEITRPPRLRSGDDVRVIAPARSRAMVNEHDHSALITERFSAMGLTLSFGEHVDERDRRDSCTTASRVADLHAAFADDSVAAVLTVIGGFNSNELLPSVDWDLIRANPKIFCGYSDITALGNAILARTGLMTYNGPHWSTFGMRRHFEPTGEWFRATVFDDDPVTLRAAEGWTDDLWFLDQDHREVHPGGWWVLNSGTATGQVLGGNLCTLNLLQGTPYWPAVERPVLVIEDDYTSGLNDVARNLTSLLQVPGLDGLAALVIGRFQRASEIDRDGLEEILTVHPVLATVPVLANVDVGHTMPLATVPLGGQVEVHADLADPRLVFTVH
ncbi:MAG: S66 peptidase family protein [bacterium]